MGKNRGRIILRYSNKAKTINCGGMLVTKRWHARKEEKKLKNEVGFCKKAAPKYRHADTRGFL